MYGGSGICAVRLEERRARRRRIPGGTNRPACRACARFARRRSCTSAPVFRPLLARTCTSAVVARQRALEQDFDAAAAFLDAEKRARQSLAYR